MIHMKFKMYKYWQAYFILNICIVTWRKYSVKTWYLCGILVVKPSSRLQLSFLSLCYIQRDYSLFLNNNGFDALQRQVLGNTFRVYLVLSRIKRCQTLNISNPGYTNHRRYTVDAILTVVVISFLVSEIGHVGNRQYIGQLSYQPYHKTDFEGWKEIA